MNHYRAALIAHYRATGLYAEEDATYAARSCRHAKSCWSGEEEKRLPLCTPPSRGQAYRPWIGAHYDNTRLVVIGENFHDHGGFDEAEGLVLWAKPKLNAGVRRLNFDNDDYKGSLFQHRAALYACAWLLAVKYNHVRFNEVGSVYDHVAFTNQVKCSPRSTADCRSTPNGTMWSNCARHVLTKELEILEARRALILGNSKNSESFFARVWPDLKPKRQINHVSYLRADDGKEALVVPHPASYGGAAWSILGDVKKILP